MEFFIIFILWMIFATLAWAVSSEDKKGLGFMLGILLGPIGILIAAVMK